MIREATVGDVAAVVIHGREFFIEAGWSDVAEYREEDCASTLRHLVESDTGILLVHEVDGAVVGMAGGMVSPLYFDFTHLSGQELFWWVRPDQRGAGAALLTALESAARKKGCKSWVMIALDRVQPERTGRIYQRRGYRASEHTYIKRL